MITISDLRQRQALPLRAKVLMTQSRIREWYNHYDGDVYVSFSGGKDSTVLAHLVHDIYPDVPLIFSNTGLEYPEIQSFARKMGAEFVRPKMMFSEVVSKYGYPVISKEVSETIWYARKIHGTEGKRLRLPGKCFKEEPEEEKGQNIRREMLQGTFETKKRKQQGAQTRSMFNKEKWLPLCNETAFLIGANCCQIMKKNPLRDYERKAKRKPIIGTLAEESRMRERSYLHSGCNAFDAKKPHSQPMSFWTEQDVLQYIRQEGLEIASVYGDIVSVDNQGFEYEPIPGLECTLKCSKCQRTGCIFCAYGAYLDKGESRFQRLAKTHPKQYEYCMRGGQWVDNPQYDPSAPKMDGEWKNWNPKKIWVPSKDGLGMKKVFDDCNAIYGKGFIRYE